MDNLNKHLRNALIGALGFGLGLVIVSGLSTLIFRSGTLEPVRDLVEGQRFTMGLVLAFAVVALGGCVWGAVGGLALSLANKAHTRVGYFWRSALSFGIGYAAVLYPLIFLLSLAGFYNPNEPLPAAFALTVGLIGALFGLASCLLLGLLTIIRHALRILLVGAFGFALGGTVFGYGLWHYFLGAEGIKGASWLLWVCLFLFGALGGAALGWVYSHLEGRKDEPIRAKLTRFYRRYGVWAIVIVVIVVFVLYQRSQITPLIPTSAHLASQLVSTTIGTHWSPPTGISDVETNAALPSLFVDEGGRVSIAWSQESGAGAEVYYAPYPWSNPVNVSHSGAVVSTNPQIVSDETGAAHIVWQEAGADIFYSQCADETCTPPTRLADLSNLECAAQSSTGDSIQPSIGINRADPPALMVTWSAGDGVLPYTTWPVTEQAPKTPTGCVPTGNGLAHHPRVLADSEDNFVLAFDSASGDGGEVYLTRYANGDWDSAPEPIGQGHTPEVFVDANNKTHVAWCGADDRLHYWTTGAQIEQIEFPGCLNRPGLAQDSDGSLHVIWYSNQVENPDGFVSSNELVYESVRGEGGWSEPAIVSLPHLPTQPAVTTGDDGTLYMAWGDASPGNSVIQYASQTQYDCTDAELSGISQTVFDVARQEKFRPASDIIPYCQNQFERIVFCPNPYPRFSDERPTVSGGFDKLADLVATAQYEVLFSTMWYEVDKHPDSPDSPGSDLARAVAVLYRQIKEDPSRYPKGLTVRILLGNPPEIIATRFAGQYVTMLADLRAAGIEEMRNPEIGWNLEVADYEGQIPHSHVKTLVVDGKSAIAVGFNYQYPHYPEDHPSGLGGNRWDLGIQATGPVAQDAQETFDDMWLGSHRLYCSDFASSSPLWVLSCSSTPATTEHVPEVKKYYLPGGDSDVFSLYRSTEYKESDEVVPRAMESATSSLDILQVNFTLPMLCDLNLLFEVCDFRDAPSYLNAIMTAVETNHARVRILIQSGSI